MLPTYKIRRFHRYLAVVVGIQILFWTLSGLYFSWSNLDEIHGDLTRAERLPVKVDPRWVSPAAILGYMADGDDVADRGGVTAAGLVTGDSIVGILDLDILSGGDRSMYHIVYLDRRGERVSMLMDAVTGLPCNPLTREEAADLAEASFTPEAPILEIDYLTAVEVGPHHEYRGGPLPVWRIRFDHPSGTRVYVSANGASIVAHRNTKWRLFDLLWMFHTMDYRGRDDINNPLLRAFSVLGLVTVVSGFVLFGVTSSRLRRRRKAGG